MDVRLIFFCKSENPNIGMSENPIIFYASAAEFLGDALQHVSTATRMPLRRCMHRLY